MTDEKIPTNDEIIKELTKDLENQCITSDERSSVTKNIPENDSIGLPHEQTQEEDIEKTLNDEELTGDDQSTTTPTIPEDYIDEEALKQLEITFSEDDLLDRHTKSIELKEQGNKEFRDELYIESLNTYTEGLRTCPLRKTENRAVLYCNRAAAKIKLKRVESAIDDCTKAIELNPQYIRAYQRRATLYEEKEKLDEALEDYKKLLELDSNNGKVREAVHRLPQQIQERNEKLKDEMMGKLKDLGNMFLKPFGLSTNNFKMQQDPNTGGYSINFQQ